MTLRIAWFAYLSVLLLLLTPLASVSSRADYTGTTDIYILNEATTPIPVYAATELNPACALVNIGQYSTQKAPTLGKVSWKTVTQPYYSPFGNPCDGMVVPTNTLQYKWTASFIGQTPTDSFDMKWSSGDGTVYTFTIKTQPFPRILNLAGSSGSNDITYTTQNVVAGQPVLPYAPGPDLAGFTNTAGGWLLPNVSTQSYIGSNGFAPFVDMTTTPNNIICNESHDCPSVPYLPTSSLQIYFTQAISPATPLNFSITGMLPGMNNGIQDQTSPVTASASVNYSVSAPTFTGPTFSALQPVGVQTFSGIGQYLGWGADFRPGIQLTASVTPPDIRTGTVYWYQVITRDKLVRYSDATTYKIYSCSIGLDDPDDTLPPPSGSTFSDGPNLALKGNENNYVRISITYEFRSYLMWPPNIDTSASAGVSPTPIALGYETWGFTADATKTIAPDGTIVWINTPTSMGGVNAPITATFTPGSTYPQWNQVVLPQTKFDTCSPV